MFLDKMLKLSQLSLLLAIIESSLQILFEDLFLLSLSLSLSQRGWVLQT